MLFVISDMKCTWAILELPDGIKLKALKAEFDALDGAEPNPYMYDTPAQSEWIDRMRAREDRLVALYGGEPCGLSEKPLVFGVPTFVGWLVQERGALRHEFSEFCLVEFD